MAEMVEGRREERGKGDMANAINLTIVMRFASFTTGRNGGWEKGRKGEGDMANVIGLTIIMRFASFTPGRNGGGEEG